MRLERLRYAREQVGYSQQELSDKSGVSQHTISEIELGRRKPHGRTLRKLAEVLGVEVADLLGGPARPLAKAPPSQEKLFNNGVLEEERRLQYLRGWRAFIYGLARLWEEEPPETKRETDPPLGALALVIEQGVFDPSGHEGPSEAQALVLILDGIRRLAEIAQKVEQGEEHNAVARSLMEKLGA
jgi:transcriptional regulator with XRE-family HTH domain